MKEYSVLLVGKIYDNHMFRFVRNLKRINPSVQIDGFAPKETIRELPKDYIICFRELKIVDLHSYFKMIPGLRSLELINQLQRNFHSFTQGRHYNIVNIHYPEYVFRYLLKDIRSCSDNIVLTPWGSDVYRISERKRKILQRVYDAADYVTGPGDRFTTDFMRIFNVPKEKLQLADIGSETIDYISENKSQLTTLEAKRKLGVESSYVISCGYNASVGQQHLKIIESIAKAKSCLPNNLILFFPVTYPKNPDYIEHLKEAVKESGLKAKWFTEYLDLQSLFELQMATDMFIHIQTTDANSTSLKEYILCEKNCVNGGWLKYDDIEEDGNKPFHVVENLEELDQVIVRAYQSGTPKVSSHVMQHIESLGCKPAADGWNKLFMRISELD